MMSVAASSLRRGRITVSVTTLLCAKQTTGGAKAADPFEGMSPEEINAFVEKSRLITAHG